MGRQPVRVHVALGANLGEPASVLRQAMAAMERMTRTRVMKRSSLYLSAPVDSSGPDYVNAVVELSSTLPAAELLRALQAIEADFGRERPYRNSPRTLDLDLLLYGAARIDSAELTVPHPRMRERAFVLVPLAEVAPDLVAPVDLARVASQAITRMPDIGS
jgi:2-amino-4-hydroxy-6-hydroxymethyldihydropteridine diphosphokinase